MARFDIVARGGAQAPAVRFPAPERTCAGYADIVNTEHALGNASEKLLGYPNGINLSRRRDLRHLRSLEMSPRRTVPIAVPLPRQVLIRCVGPVQKIRKPLASRNHRMKL